MKTASTTDKNNAGTNKELRRMLQEKSLEMRSHLKLPTANPVLHASEEPYDSADWAGKSHEEWIFLKKNSVDMATLREIDDALDRLRDGTYGICMDCGIAISRKRLDAVPWALYCVTCQDRRQTGHN